MSDVVGVAGAAIAPRTSRQCTQEIDLGEDLDEIARSHRARLHEILVCISREPCAHEDVQHVVDMGLGLQQRQIALRREARVKFEWQQ